MRAVRCTAKGLALVEVATPEPGPDQVVIAVRSATICGSDLHLVDLGPRPVTFGHELVGELDGALVTICPVEYCGTCASCMNGVSALCTVGSNQVIGIHRDGGMADVVVVPRQCVVPLDGLADPTMGYLVEPVAVAVHGWNTIERFTPLPAGARVVVVGGGPVGLVAGALGKARGYEVDIVVRHDAQRRAAQQLGLGLQASGKYDVAVDAGGTASAVALATKLCRPGGTLLISGTYWGDVTMPGMALQLKELRILPVIYYGHHRGERELDAAVGVLAQLPALGEALITHRFPLDQAVEAFRVAGDRAAGAVKVLLEV